MAQAGLDKLNTEKEITVWFCEKRTKIIADHDTWLCGPISDYEREVVGGQVEEKLKHLDQKLKKELDSARLEVCQMVPPFGFKLGSKILKYPDLLGVIGSFLQAL